MTLSRRKPIKAKRLVKLAIAIAFDVVLQPAPSQLSQSEPKQCQYCDIMGDYRVALEDMETHQYRTVRSTPKVRGSLNTPVSNRVAVLKPLAVKCCSLKMLRDQTEISNL